MYVNLVQSLLPQRPADFRAAGLSDWYGAAISSCQLSTSQHSVGKEFVQGLLTDPSELPAFHNIAGQYAVAVQQGASNVSNTYGYILEAGQHIFALTTTVVLVATRAGPTPPRHHTDKLRTNLDQTQR